MIKVQTLETIKDKLQALIDDGTRSIEQLHQQTVDWRFELKGRVGFGQQADPSERDRQHRRISETYEAIRRLNHQIGDLLSEQLQAREQAQELNDVVERSYASSRAAERMQDGDKARATDQAEKKRVRSAVKKVAARAGVRKRAAGKKPSNKATRPAD